MCFKILVAEKDLIARTVTRYSLARLDAAPAFVGNCREAQKVCEEGGFDAIIVNLATSLHECIEIVSKARKLKPDIPIIAIADEPAVTALKDRNLQADVIITPPYHTDALAEAVVAVLGIKKSEACP